MVPCWIELLASPAHLVWDNMLRLVCATMQNMGCHNLPSTHPAYVNALPSCCWFLLHNWTLLARFMVGIASLLHLMVPHSSFRYGFFAKWASYTWHPIGNCNGGASTPRSRVWKVRTLSINELVLYADLLSMLPSLTQLVGCLLPRFYAQTRRPFWLSTTCCACGGHWPCFPIKIGCNWGCSWGSAFVG
jgi:hypothetical protein